MMRTTYVLVLAIIAAAVAALPAAASGGYESVDSIVAGTTQSGTANGERTLSENTVREYFSGSVSGSVSEISNSGYRSTDAIIATGSHPLSVAQGDGHPYGTAGSPAPPQPSPITVGSGFQWLDALFGALIVSGLLVVMLAGAWTVVRRRRITVGSPA